MTTPRDSGVDPQLVARLSGQFASLGDHLRQVSGDLGALHAQLVAEPRTPAPQQYQVPQQFQVPQQVPVHRVSVPPQPPVSFQPPASLQPPVSQWAASSMPRSAPPQPQQPARPVVSARPSRPAEQKQPWWQRDGVISRVLAVAGAGVTLVGVVMLLVLAAQAGWFGPELRVASGAVLSASLVYVGHRVFATPGGRVGGIALAATGVAGLYLDLVAVTVLYAWLEPALGLIAAFGVAAAGVALAVSWKSQPMAVLILAGVAVCAPVVTGGITLALIAFFTATFIAAFVAQLGRDWPMLGVARTLPVVVSTIVAVAQASWSGVSDSALVPLLVVAATIAVFGIGSSAELLRRRAADIMATAIMAASALPILLVGGLFAPWTATVIEGVVAVASLIALVALSWLPNHARIVLVLIGSIALLEAVMIPTSVELRPLALLVVAAVMIVAAGRTSSKPAYFVGAAFAAFGALGVLTISPPAVFLDSDLATADLGVVFAGLLLAAVSVGLVVVAAQLAVAAQNLQACWVTAGLVALYGSTSATVALGVAAIGGDTGFVAGHCAATIEWMAAAMALLALGLRSEKYAHTALLAGLSLTAASVAKLFLFDLVALDGLFRVGAFIVVGLLLLFAGTRYARVFAGRTPSTDQR